MLYVMYSMYKNNVHIIKRFVECKYKMRIKFCNFQTIYGGYEPSRNRDVVLARQAT